MKTTYIDGVELQDEILIFMPRLKKFAFNLITSLLCNKVDIFRLPNEDIQRSFIDWKFGQVASHLEMFSVDTGQIRHHIYSLPYEFDFFYVSSTFQGGTFDNVRRLLMKDSRPFECHFFKMISQHFPFLTGLYVANRHPQNEQRESTTPIVFPYLARLSLGNCHEDYVYQLLVHSKCHLPRLSDLTVGYTLLAIVTNNFTNDATRPACSKVTNLTLNESFVRTKHFDEYFPCCKDGNYLKSNQ